MKTQTQFKDASIVSIVNGSIVVKDSTGGEHTFTNASVVSVNNGTIIIRSEWKPKVGELIKLTGGNTDCYCIYRECQTNRIYDYGYKKIANSILNTEIDDLSWCTVDVIVSPVTPEEQKEFDDFCKSQGKIWNKETLQWEKYRWQPKKGELYFSILLRQIPEIAHYSWTGDSLDMNFYKMGNCFKTEEEVLAKLEQIKKLLLEV